METVQVVIDKKLLQAADAAARRSGRNRSALIRVALREHLDRLNTQILEARDREGYRKRPQTDMEAEFWDREQVWPEP